jgi:hypothetical protein
MDALPCRKCQTPNPATNQYCRKCGAVLQVATALVQAQPKTLLPFTRRFRWRWVALGVPVILGAATLAVVGIAVAATAVLDSNETAGSLAALGSRAPGLAVGAGAAFLLAFAVGGLVVGRMAKERSIAEPALASLVVLCLLAAAASPLSGDAPLIAAVLALPAALAAGLGGWFGVVSEKKGPSR